ncbi:homeobox protein PKNOX1-like [Tropilaelaps mercedesae]|uniref:Homeobox protein PKNOX1-like n=1 Tax=Tropilaelaps mercedesae TaxID=418985 RepID=A0A1V9WZV6_9ACAR|nr:homeobox protein PKNOX1-like [Tropilaelaps mercedesae]
MNWSKSIRFRMSDCSEPDQDPELDEDADIDVEHVAPTNSEEIHADDTACSKADSNDQSNDADCDVKADSSDNSSRCNDFEHEQSVEDENELGPEETEMVKRALLRHPLFPLLALLFEKCELATRTCGAEPSANELKRELEAFAESTTCWSGGESAIDQLMIDALQVLRIHLGELRKVDELRNNFCQRYIACLRDKMHSSKLLKDAHFDSEDVDSDECDLLSSGSGGENSQEGGGSLPETATVPAATKKASRAPSRSAPSSNAAGPAAGVVGSSSRGVLPKQATELMRAWLFAHIVHPYPSEEEKKLIAEQTNLSLLQVNNWFINARRRILQPMLEQNAQKT